MQNLWRVIAIACFALVTVIGCAAPTPTPTPVPTVTPTATKSPIPAPTRRGERGAQNVPPTSTPTRARTQTLFPTATNIPTKTPLPAGKITRVDTKYKSAALNEDRKVIIYLPPGYNDSPQRRYPVLILLHGYGGCLDPEPEWEAWGLKDDLESLTTKGQIQPMIVALPNGFMGDCQPSYWFNHGPGTDNKRWGDAVSQDLVNYLDATYRTIKSKESRALGGYSLGGQGALSLSLRNPEIFKVVGAHSPSFRSADGSIVFINDWNYFNQYDPIYLTQNTNAAQQLTLWLDVGDDDDKVRRCGTGSDRCVEAYRALLVARKIAHEWHGDWDGKHEGTYWSEHIPDYLKWYSTKLKGQ